MWNMEYGSWSSRPRTKEHRKQSQYIDMYTLIIEGLFLHLEPSQENLKLWALSFAQNLEIV